MKLSFPLSCVALAVLLPGSFGFAQSTGSLWNSSVAGSMYTDGIARSTGDVVTILIEESSSISTSRRSESGKSSNVNSGLDQLLYTADAWGRNAPLTRRGELPRAQWSSNDSFAGGGAVSGDQSVVSRISAVVLDRLPNGLLVVEGVRKIQFNNETNYIVLRGLIRERDIASDNTVSSARLAEAQIELIGEGTLTEAQRQGWLNRMFSWMNPF